MCLQVWNVYDNHGAQGVRYLQLQHAPCPLLRAMCMPCCGAAPSLRLLSLAKKMSLGCPGSLRTILTICGGQSQHPWISGWAEWLPEGTGLGAVVVCRPHPPLPRWPWPSWPWQLELLTFYPLYLTLHFHYSPLVCFVFLLSKQPHQSFVVFRYFLVEITDRAISKNFPR